MLNLTEWRRVKQIDKKKQLLAGLSAGNTKMEPLLGISFPSFICHHCYFWKWDMKIRSWYLEGDPWFVLLFYLHCHNPGGCRLELVYSTWAAWRPLCHGRCDIKRNLRSETKPHINTSPNTMSALSFGLFFPSSLIFFIRDIKNCKAWLELTVIFILSIRGLKKGNFTETKRNTVNSWQVNGDANIPYLWRTT